MIRFICVLIFLATTAFAVEPDEILSDPALEARARAISANLRCVVCQNEPIDTSNAGVARDLRILVRDRLVEGDTNTQVYDYVVARYGDYVLFKPPWKPTTYALWLAPFVIGAFGLLAVVSVFRRSVVRSQVAQQDLSPEEEALLAQIAKDNSDRTSS
jgi:cytochrome c-type biogenesis protein CcmH